MSKITTQSAPHKMLYSCTYMATVGVKGSSDLVEGTLHELALKAQTEPTVGCWQLTVTGRWWVLLTERILRGPVTVQSHEEFVGQHKSFVLYALQWWSVCPGPTFSKLLWKILRRFLTFGQSLTISEKTPTRHNLFNNNIITSNMTQNKNVNYNYYCFIIS